ncbi:hypothetical protein PHSY_002355 [Pseudozyma hubeiensis SY62]|uniref:DUF1746 domain-containing protein n=1 Tax=Pseudozyma hubeiensis (strain SY62) TaxID=1305764 RepID=R9P111_PSEHS|nr:hypothetical protein PHSY_002355 [Pseudozyma hubeiensis SY62]GAC94782.1 hypothetical protein PHSY_002355 [Pseudozyma hubeiensis SY62]
MYFERKELIQSLDLLCFVLFVYTWLLDNRTFLLLVKAALQVQFCNPLQICPTWSLPFIVVFLCSLNLTWALVHLWTPASKTNTGESILIDFVGHTTLPGRLHMLLIDAVVWGAQLLMTVIAFEMGKDEVKGDEEPSELDDRTTLFDEDDLGQGWNVRDEEANLFGLDQDDERKRQHTSLTHHVAVVRLRPIYDQILARQFLPDPPAEETLPDPAPSPQSPPIPLEPSNRPDTSRIRRFSRRPRNTTPAVTEQDEPYRGLGPVSADDSWPPMWLILARNTIGGELRFPSFRPMQGVASIRNTLFGRFGRTLSQTPDRSQYTRVNPDAPSDN